MTSHREIAADAASALQNVMTQINEVYDNISRGLAYPDYESIDFNEGYHNSAKLALNMLKGMAAGGITTGQSSLLEKLIAVQEQAEGFKHYMRGSYIDHKSTEALEAVHAQMESIIDTVSQAGLVLDNQPLSGTVSVQVQRVDNVTDQAAPQTGLVRRGNAGAASALAKPGAQAEARPIPPEVREAIQFAINLIQTKPADNRRLVAAAEARASTPAGQSEVVARAVFDLFSDPKNPRSGRAFVANVNIMTEEYNISYMVDQIISKMGPLGQWTDKAISGNSPSLPRR